eukprot:3146654-Pyramimonas_sp.AAC.2
MTDQSVLCWPPAGLAPACARGARPAGADTRVGVVPPGQPLGARAGRLLGARVPAPLARPTP